MRVAIIGGGIAGLAAAYELESARRAGYPRTGSPAEYELFEASSRLGGVLSSSMADGTVIEHGPDSFLTEKPAAAELCRELGLEADLMGSNDAERKTFIVVRNRLVALPDGLMFLVPTKLLPMVLTPLFGWLTKIRMGLELLHSPKAKSNEDESVASLVRRHYGQQAVERLADPLLSGIYGGEAEKLSARAVLPRLMEMEAKHGSLTRGMLAGIKARKAAAEADPEAVSTPKPLFTTLRYGLQQLVDGLTARLDPTRVHLHAPVLGVERDGDGWLVEVRESVKPATVERFDAVIVAAPAWAAAEFLRPVDAVLSGELEQIEYSSSATVNLVYDGADLDPLPQGFGFLAPAAEGRSIMACTFLHRKFPGRTAWGKSVLRAFVGGAHNLTLLAQPDEEIVERVQRDLLEILQISAIPEYIEVRRWPRAMAQYSVGHQARQKRIRERLAALPGLHLAGNAYDGIGISDCIRLGRGAAREITRQDAPAIAQSHR